MSSLHEELKVNPLPEGVQRLSSSQEKTLCSKQMWYMMDQWCCIPEDEVTKLCSYTPIMGDNCDLICGAEAVEGTTRCIIHTDGYFKLISVDKWKTLSDEIRVKCCSYVYDTCNGVCGSPVVETTSRCLVHLLSYSERYVEDFMFPEAPRCCNVNEWLTYCSKIGANCGFAFVDEDNKVIAHCLNGIVEEGKCHKHLPLEIRDKRRWISNIDLRCMTKEEQDKICCRYDFKSAMVCGLPLVDEKCNLHGIRVLTPENEDEDGDSGSDGDEPVSIIIQESKEIQKIGDNLLDVDSSIRYDFEVFVIRLRQLLREKDILMNKGIILKEIQDLKFMKFLT